MACLSVDLQDSPVVVQFNALPCTPVKYVRCQNAFNEGEKARFRVHFIQLFEKVGQHLHCNLHR